MIKDLEESGSFFMGGWMQRKRKMKRYLAMTNNPCYNVFIL